MTELLKEIQKKDENAVKLLYNRYGKKLYGYAVSKWNLDEDEAWDIVYTTLYKTIEVIDKYTFLDEKKFIGFIFTVFSNNLRNYYNKKKTIVKDTVELKDEHGNMDLNTTHSESNSSSVQMKLLQQELSKMDDWKRVLLLMRSQDYTYEEIAKYVNKPVEQLKVYYMRFKKQLTEKINEQINTSI